MKLPPFIIVVLLAAIGCSGGSNTLPGTYVFASDDHASLTRQICEVAIKNPANNGQMGMSEDLCTLTETVNRQAEIILEIEEGGRFNVSQIHQAAELELPNPFAPGYLDVSIEADTFRYGGAWARVGESDTLNLAYESVPRGSEMIDLFLSNRGGERFVFQGSSLKYVIPPTFAAETEEELAFIQSKEILFKQQ